MATANTLAASVGASSSAVVSNNCRIASLSIAAYEYVAGGCLLTVIVT